MNAITNPNRTWRWKADLARRYTPAERDEHFYQREFLALRRDASDFAPERLIRWELREQVKAAALHFRAGGPHPGDLSMHRLSHSDSIRRMRTGSVSPYPLARRRAEEETALNRATWPVRAAA